MKQRLNGFTFIEVMLVVAISITIGVLSTAFYSRFYTQHAVQEYTDQVISQLRKAQLYSMLGKRNTQWGVKYDSNKVILFSGASYATRNAALDESFSISSNVTISGLNEIVFTKLSGAPSATPTITLTHPGQTSTVTVNAQGTVSKL